MKFIINTCASYIGFVLMPILNFAQTDSAAATKHKQTLLFPVVAKSIETGWSFGGASSFTFHLSKNDTTTRTSNLQTLLLYSLKKQFIAVVNGSQYFSGKKYILNEQVSYSSFPDKFWGLGKNSSSDSVENYNFKQYYINFHLLKHLGNNFYIGIPFELQSVFDIAYIKGGLFDKQNIRGRNGYLVAGLGLSFTYDNRNNAFAPDKGGFAQLYFNHFDSYLGSSFVYSNIVLDVRKYFKLHKQQVLAVQFYSFGNLGNDVPLRSLASLGGSTSMRGYYSGRYRDYQQVVCQSEYRLPVYKRFGAVVFGGLGDVGNTSSDFSFSNLKYSFGGGLRYAINKNEKLNIRLDYGLGKDGNSGLYFQLGEAF